MEASLNPSLPLRSKKTSLGCLFVFLLPFLGLGAMAVWVGFGKIQQGGTKDGLAAIIVGLVFLVVAGAFLVIGTRAHRKTMAQALVEAENPKAPWLWRPEWREGRIRSNDGRAAAFLWGMAILFIGISLPVVLAIPKELEKGNRAILIALLFPFAGVGLAVAAARATIRRQKFGRSELELHTLPGVLGGTLSGALLIPSTVTPAKGFTLRLLCIQRRTSGSGKNKSTHESVLWEEQKTLLRDFATDTPDTTALPVFFTVPFDQPESKQGNPAILWRLEVKAVVPGIDYFAQFEVPVFQMAESRPDAVPVKDPTAAFQPDPGTWSPPVDSRIRVQETAHGETEVRFPAARNAGVILGLLVFLAIWTGAIWFMIEHGAPLMFPIVFGLFELLLITFVVQLLFHSLRVTADRSGITVHHHLILLSWKHRVEQDDLDSIKLRSSMQSGTKVYYDLVLHTRSGRTVNAGTHVPDKKHAQWLASQLSDATGVPT